MSHDVARDSPVGCLTRPPLYAPEKAAEELIVGQVLPSTPMNTATALTEDSQTRLRISDVVTTKRAPKAHKEVLVVDQIIGACKKGLRNRIALWAGLIGGGIIPLGSWLITHYELCAFHGWDLAWQVQTYAVLGGLLFSAITVFTWLKSAYANPYKATGAVVFLEVVMTTSYQPPDRALYRHPRHPHRHQRLCHSVHSQRQGPESLAPHHREGMRPRI